MANLIIALLIALITILVSLGCLVWIIVDTYHMWRFRQELYGKVVNDDE